MREKETEIQEKRAIFTHLRKAKNRMEYLREWPKLCTQKNKFNENESVIVRKHFVDATFQLEKLCQSHSKRIYTQRK